MAHAAGEDPAAQNKAIDTYEAAAHYKVTKGCDNVRKGEDKNAAKRKEHLRKEAAKK
jgi:hypothetical protein